MYKSTTNPIIATGDGVAMTYRAKGRVEGMEFMQFHPTSLYHPTGENPAFLVSEAVRGFGGILKTAEGDTFMEHYDERLSLAPRDDEPGATLPGLAQTPGLAGLSLDLGAPDETITGTVRDERWYDVQTKFDLAKAYQEMGDKEGAREILDEVVAEGDDSQKKAARDLLATLS